MPPHPLLQAAARVLAAGASCLLLHLPLATRAATAPGTGTVQGRVFNPATRDYVRDAEVRLEGTTRVDYTQNDGSFEFTNVPAGSATITVTYTGYNTMRETFTV